MRDPQRPLRCKTFSATMAKEREALGDKVSQWIANNRPVIVNKEVLQSSDSEFHCLTIVIWYQMGSR